MDRGSRPRSWLILIESILAETGRAVNARRRNS